MAKKKAKTGKKKVKKTAKSKLRSILTGALLLLLISMVVFAVILIEIFPMKITLVNSGVLKVDGNVSIDEIAGLLKENRFILHEKGFVFITKFYGDKLSFKSGTHNLQSVENVFQLIAELQRPGLPDEITVTFPEGFSVKDIANRLAENGVISDVAAFVEYAGEFEGFLFPDTYRFVEGESFESIVLRMRKRFNEITGSNYELLCSEKGFDLKEAVTLASIIEREAKLDSDRPIVASVFINRLKEGMPLQADCTINYLLPEHKEWLSKEDYEIDSPYNTYKYAGLPPGPICNPGRASLFSVVEAPETDYFYFMTTPEGKAIFSKTLAEHERNLRKYYGGN